MTTTFQNPAFNGISTKSKTAPPSAISRLIRWAESQNDQRLVWLGISVMAHGCFLTPYTVMVIMLTGNSFILCMGALSAMGISLVTNLAALPTKITIPAFILSIVMDVIIVAIALSTSG